MTEETDARITALETELGHWKSAHEALVHRLDETEKWMVQIVEVLNQALTPHSH